MKELRRLFTGALVLVMLLGLMPFTAFAAAGDLTVTVQYDSASAAPGAAISGAYVILYKETAPGSGKFVWHGYGQTNASGQYTWTGLDTTRAYEVDVQNANEYDGDSITVTALEIAAGASKTIEVPEATLNCLAVNVKYGDGTPVPAGIEITLCAFDYSAFQVYDVTKRTDSLGRVKFADYLLDESSPLIILKYEYLGTTYMKYMELANTGASWGGSGSVSPGGTTGGSGGVVTQSSVDIYYPSVAISGTVTDVLGNTVANQRVVTLDNTDVSKGDGGWNNLQRYIGMSGDLGEGFATYTDASGNYTLWLPGDPGETYEICLIDEASINDGSSGLVKEYNEFMPSHGKATHEELTYQTVNGMNSSNRNLEMTGTYTLKATFYDAATSSPLTTGSVSFTLKSAFNSHNTGSYSYDSYVFTSGGGGNVNKTVSLVPGTYTVKVPNYDAIMVTITRSDIISGGGTVDLGSFYLNGTPPITYPPSSGGSAPSWSTGPTPSSIPPYGWVQTRLEQVSAPMFSDHSFEVTLHYKGFYNHATINQVTNVKIEINIPDGMNVETAFLPAGITYNPTARKLTKTIASLPTETDFKDTFFVTIDPTSSANYYAITSFVTITESSTPYTNFTNSLTFQRLHINLMGPRLAPEDSFVVFGDITGAGENQGVQIRNASTNALYASTNKDGRWYYGTVRNLPAGIYNLRAETERNSVPEYSNILQVSVGNSLNYVKDSFIMTSEGVTIYASAKRKVPSYTSFVNIDKDVKTFNIYTKINNSGSGDTVVFKVLGQTFTATYDSGTDYWHAVISGLNGYGDHEIMVSTNGNETLAGTLLLLFGG